jgi:hypothetical protein
MLATLPNINIMQIPIIIFGDSGIVFHSPGYPGTHQLS